MVWQSRSSELFTKILQILFILFLITILIGGIIGCSNTLLTYFGAPPIDSVLIDAVFSWAYLLRVFVDSNLILIGVVCISFPIILLVVFTVRHVWLAKSTTSRDDEVVKN